MGEKFIHGNKVTLLEVHVERKMHACPPFLFLSHGTLVLLATILVVIIYYVVFYVYNF
jgi:hypothetical protein